MSNIIHFNAYIPSFNTGLPFVSVCVLLAWPHWFWRLFEFFLSVFCPRSGISHFSKELWSETMIRSPELFLAVEPSLLQGFVLQTLNSVTSSACMGMEHRPQPLRWQRESTVLALPWIISLFKNSSWVKPNKIRESPLSTRQKVSFNKLLGLRF